MIVTQRTEVPDIELLHTDDDVEVHIYREQSPLDPLADYPDHPVTLELSHGRYDLGDRDAPTDRCGSWSEIAHDIKGRHVVVAMSRLYLLDHSGLRISTSPFRSQWDSGCVGFAYVTEEDMPDYSDRDMDRPEPEEVVGWIEDRVEEYDYYLRGEVYRYVLFEDGEQVDSCSGFYGVGRDGENENMWDYIGYDHDDFKVVERAR